MNVREFKREIVEPVLRRLELHSAAAVALMMGTAVHESAGLRYLRQRGGGPALSFFQVEPATAEDIIKRYLPSRVPLWARFEAATMWRSELWGDRIAERLVGDMAFACAVARLKYWQAPAPLPEADDLEGLAAYWGKWYQTESDPAKMQRFMVNYRGFLG